MPAYPSAHTPMQLGPLRVMVVEDEALVALLVEDELLDAGVRVTGCAGSVAHALRLLDALMTDGGLDAALLDVNLGGESVIPVADALAGHAVPFLFMTGYADGGERGCHAAVPTLRKPFNPRDLIATLATVLAVRRAMPAAVIAAGSRPAAPHCPI